jgi:hypothetical protein
VGLVETELSESSSRGNPREAAGRVGPDQIAVPARVGVHPGRLVRSLNAQIPLISRTSVTGISRDVQRIDATSVELKLDGLNLPRRVASVTDRFVMIHDLPVERLASVLLACSEMGFRPAIGTLYTLRAQVLVSVVCRLEPGTWVFSVGLSESQLRASHDEQQRGGLGLSDLSAVSTKFPKFLAIWLSGYPVSDLMLSQNVSRLDSLEKKPGAWLTGCLHASEEGDPVVSYAWCLEYKEVLGLRAILTDDRQVVARSIGTTDVLELDVARIGTGNCFFLVYAPGRPLASVVLVMNKPSVMHGHYVRVRARRRENVTQLASVSDGRVALLSSLWQAQVTSRPWIVNIDVPINVVKPRPPRVTKNDPVVDRNLTTTSNPKAANRSPAPVPAKVDAVLIELRELHAATYSVVKDQQEKIAFGDKLYAAAEKENDPVLQWGLLLLSEQLCIQAGAIELWHRIAASRLKHFDLTADAVQVAHYDLVLADRSLDSSIQLLWGEEAIYRPGREMSQASMWRPLIWRKQPNR